jgi:N-acetylmuramoyl-L-alanine amidase
MRKINRIIVHTSFTKPSMNIGAKEIRLWHTRDNGWNDIGYHYVIKRDGTLEEGRKESVVGAHVGGHNSDSLGICMVGGMNEAGKADCNYTYEQYDTLYCLIKSLRLKYKDADVSGHRDWAARDCPVFDAKAFVKNMVVE